MHFFIIYICVCVTHEVMVAWHPPAQSDAVRIQTLSRNSSLNGPSRTCIESDKEEEEPPIARRSSLVPFPGHGRARLGGKGLQG